MDISKIELPNVGVLTTKLNENIIQELWKLVDDAKEIDEPYNKELSGNITLSLQLKNGEKILSQILEEMTAKYQESYGIPFNYLRTGKENYITVLDSLWVNFQYQHEFNPIHKHSGGYSFVIWMKIPTHCKEQKNLPITNSSANTTSISNFAFIYSDILGVIREFVFNMSDEAEGHLLLFPAGLKHQVYPFYNCDDVRISISGNLGISISE